jgi:hypothetical protein
VDTQKVKNINRGNFEFLSTPFLWVVLGLLIVGYYLFQLSLTSGWMYRADTATNVLAYHYQFSGIARGEYPLWNPLNRAGEPLYFFQALLQANPISNLSILISLLFGITNIVFSYTIYIFSLVVIYVLGVYLLVSVLTKNRYAATFAALISVASSPVFFVCYSETPLKIIHAVPWILFSLIQYQRTLNFRYVAFFLLSFCSVIYSYQPTYAFSFFICIFVSYVIFYWKNFSIKNVQRIPYWHITLFSVLLFSIIAPIIQIALVMIDGAFLPPASRINLATLAVTEDLNVKFDFLFNRFPEFFFERENLMAVIFTGAFWAKNTAKLTSGWTTLIHFLGPMVFPFLLVALFSRRRIVLCFGLSAILITLQAGEYFPGSLIYKLRFFYLIKYGSLLNLFFGFSVIILSALGFNIFFKNRNSFYQRIVIGSASFLILGCILLATILPGRAYSNSVLTLTSFTMMIFIILIFSGQISKKILFNTLFALMVISSIFFQSLILNYYPDLKGAIYTDSMNSGIVALRNKEDHSLYFSMERPNHQPWAREKSAPDLSRIARQPAGNDEYSSFISLTDAWYKPSLEVGGLASFPIIKNYFAFLSLPGSDNLLRQKFHYFNHVIPISMPNYIKKLSHEAKLTSKLLEKNIAVVTNSTYRQSPIYLKQSVLDNVENHQLETNELNVKVIKYNANNIQLQVTTDREGLLTYTDSWDEGWHAKVDGVPVTVMRVFDILKGVEISAGTHQVEFYFTNGILWSLITMNITYFIILFATAGGILMRTYRHL